MYNVLKSIHFCVVSGSIPPDPFKGTLACDFFVLIFCTYRTHIGQIKRLLKFFDFVLEFADLFEFFNIRWWLSWRRVSFLVNWVNAKWASTSTESMRNDKIFLNVGVSALTQLTWRLTPRWLSWHGVSLRVDSVDVESHSALTQLKESLTLLRLSVNEMNQAKTGIHNQLWRL